MRPAPGTWGTLGAIPLIFLGHFLGEWGYLVLATVLTVCAMIVSQIYENQVGQHDSSEVVIDEVAGFVVAMTWVPLFSWKAWVIGFLLFRCIDILKPPPINWIDQRVSGGVGVVADDVVGGIIVNIILQIIFTKTSWLGLQLGTPF